MSAKLFAGRIGAGALLALAGLAFAGSAAASGVAGSPAGVQGNPQGVRLAERAAQAFSDLPAFTYSQRGFFQMDVSGGSISYYYGYGALHAGFVWAAEQGTVALHDGAVVWWRDDLTPVSGRGSSVELVANSEGVFSALGSAGHHTCFTRVDGSVPYSSGDEAYSPVGRYLNGGSPLRSVYRWWSTGQTASETDAITSSGLLTSGRISVAPGAGFAGFTIDFSNSFAGGTPPAPGVNLCG